jgi:hypothetical protein
MFGNAQMPACVICKVSNVNKQELHTDQTQDAELSLEDTSATRDGIALPPDAERWHQPVQLEVKVVKSWIGADAWPTVVGATMLLEPHLAGYLASRGLIEFG